jgi:general secretion pathway protein E
MQRKNGQTLSGTRDFSIETLTQALKQAGLLSDNQVEEIYKTAPLILSELSNRFKTRESEQPYISPIEIIASIRLGDKTDGKEKSGEAELIQSYAKAANTRFIRIDPLKLDAKSVCSIISKPFARKNLLVPIKLEGGKLTVAMVNPFDKEAIQSLEDVTGYTIEPVLGLRSEILKTINEIFAFEYSLIKAEKTRRVTYDLGNLEQLVDINDRELDASDQHIINAVDLLLQYAYEQMASDIHIEPKREKAVVRLRIDGRLQTTHTIPKKVFPSFASRIKIMASLDIAEKRKPQDGRIKTTHRGTEVELRVSSVPVAFGEKIVIRIFDPHILMQELPSLGFFPEQLDAFKSLIKKPYGIILVTGPTGSGKTTTLYSAMKFLASSEINITTIEDPIEMVYEPFNQIAVHHQINLDFTTALRHVLRQDPDVIMVGEIRDHETAEYAVQAALTGHLVLTTLHTNNAASAITRLRDLKIESFLIASTLLGVIAQRLVRRICPRCYTGGNISYQQMELLGIDSENASLEMLRKGKGCQYCRHTGYKSRKGIFEVLVVDNKIRTLIRDEADEDEIARSARKAGTESLLNSGIKNLLSGQTTVEEILRVVPLVR